MQRADERKSFKVIHDDNYNNQTAVTINLLQYFSAADESEDETEASGERCATADDDDGDDDALRKNVISLIFRFCYRSCVGCCALVFAPFFL